MVEKRREVRRVEGRKKAGGFQSEILEHLK